jgi:hypothetical protein
MYTQGKSAEIETPMHCNQEMVEMSDDLRQYARNCVICAAYAPTILGQIH